MNIFITGISRGLGRALAETFAANGHEVWGIARTVQDRTEGRITSRMCDIVNGAQVQAVCDEMIGTGFIPDAVILNAALLENDFQDRIDFERFREIIEVNLLGNIQWLQLLLTHVQDRPGGAFVNVSSLVSFRAIVRQKIAYPASKCAMDMVFEGMRIQLRDDRVRFITIRIGPLDVEQKMPLITSTYRKAARVIVNKVESGANGTFVYPAAAGVLFRMAKVLPDSIIRKVIHKGK